MHKQWTEAEIELLREKFPITSNKELELFFNRKHHAIEEIARKRGIKRLPETVIKYRTRKGTLKRLLDEEPETYYWIGMLMADGYIHHGLSQVVLSLAEEDKDQLKKFADFLSAEVKVYKGAKGYRDDRLYQYRVSVAEKLYCQPLIKKFDFKPTKTYNPPAPSVLKISLADDNKFLCFLVGIIDGDGYIIPDQIRLENHPSWVIVHEFLEKRLKQIFQSERPFTKIEYSKRGYVSLFIRNKRILGLIKKVAIENKLPFFERKWNKISENGINKRENEKEILKNILDLIKEGKTINQISEILKINSGSLRSYIHRKKIKYNYERNWKINSYQDGQL